MVCCPVLPNPVQICTPTYAWTLTTLIGLLSYGPCAHHTGWKQRKRGWNIVSLLVMLAALIVAETVFAVTQGKIIQSMYIEHRGYPGGPLAILPRHPGFSTICAHVRKPVRTDLPRRPARDTCNSEVPSSHRHTLTHLTVMALLGHLVSIYTRVAVLVTSIPAFVLAASFGEQPTCHNTV